MQKRNELNFQKIIDELLELYKKSMPILIKNREKLDRKNKK